MGNKVRRFYYTGAISGRVAHRFYSLRFIEGELTACGVRVRRGWLYWLRTAFEARAICKRCEKTNGK